MALVPSAFPLFAHHSMRASPPLLTFGDSRLFQTLLGALPLLTLYPRGHTSSSAFHPVLLRFGPSPGWQNHQGRGHERCQRPGAATLHAAGVSPRPWCAAVAPSPPVLCPDAIVAVPFFPARPPRTNALCVLQKWRRQRRPASRPFSPARCAHASSHRARGIMRADFFWA